MHWIIVSDATLFSPYSFKHQQKRFLKLGPYLFSSLGGSLDEPAEMVAIWFVGVERAHGVEKVEVGQSHLSTPSDASQCQDEVDSSAVKRFHLKCRFGSMGKRSWPAKEESEIGV